MIMTKNKEEAKKTRSPEEVSKVEKEEHTRTGEEERRSKKRGIKAVLKCEVAGEEWNIQK